jgi:hypothetical protein
MPFNKVHPRFCAAPRQVLYGMDYTAEERQQQHTALRMALLEHLRQAPESREQLVVGQPASDA